MGSSDINKRASLCHLAERREKQTCLKFVDECNLADFSFLGLCFPLNVQQLHRPLLLSSGQLLLSGQTNTVF